MKEDIHSDKAPAAMGPYSQGVRVGNMVYFSGQIPLDPATMRLVSDDFEAQAMRVFANLHAVCSAAGGGLDHIVKLSIYLTDLAKFPILNEVMQGLFSEPYPARTTVQVSALPKGAQVEVDAVMVVK